MDTGMTEQEILEEAKRRVKKKREFLGHLGSYVAINAVLIVIWALSGQGYKWFLWPLGIWGVFVVWNFLDVYVFRTTFQSEKSAIQKEIDRIKRGG
ncbi:2TM domain-containing protein [Dehalogenimonas formicexedens]|uniref:2TM domain-containing protein n=1 Tax=Dehalogenimonas formicexedens TaxID=1839801 RepID=A0A1P8F879_9CHLR|nr:2TM domain-containing protein [Dehalogenimonas formicexedens]APV44681.1 2TM domain-containing protein [Dehalogenimonas formicexedens]